jgi:hypothetical protein
LQAREGLVSDQKRGTGREVKLTARPTQLNTTTCWILSKKYATLVEAMAVVTKLD